MPRPTFEKRLYPQPLFDVNASRASLLYGGPSPCPTQPSYRYAHRQPRSVTPTAASMKRDMEPNRRLRPYMGSKTWRRAYQIEKKNPKP